MADPRPPPGEAAGGWIEVPPPGQAGPASPEEHLRPSLLAALDTPLKVLAGVAAFLVPIVVPALVRGETLTAAGIFLAGQTFYLYWAVIVALIPAVQLAFTRYIVDDEGIRVHVQIVSKSERRVPWEKVTALRHRRTLVDAALGIERLEVIAYGQRGATLKLVGLRGAATLRDRVGREMRDAATLESHFRSD